MADNSGTQKESSSTHLLIVVCVAQGLQLLSYRVSDRLATGHHQPQCHKGHYSCTKHTQWLGHLCCHAQDHARQTLCNAARWLFLIRLRMHRVGSLPEQTNPQCREDQHCTCVSRVWKNLYALQAKFCVCTAWKLLTKSVKAYLLG